MDGTDVRAEGPLATIDLRSLLVGALHGAVAWGTYLVVEQALFTLVPLSGGRDGMLATTQWRVLAILAVAFPAIGFVLGGGASLAFGFLRKVQLVPGILATKAGYRGLATMTFTAAFAANLLMVKPLGKAGEFALAVSSALTLGALLACTSEKWQRKIGFLTNPWVASALMLTGSWIGQQALPGFPVLLQLAVAVVALLVITLAGKVGSLSWSLRAHRGNSLFPKWAAGVLAVSAAGLVGCSALWSRGLGALSPLKLAPPPGRPNVILITMDTVREDHLSLYGYARDTTPFLKGFAAGATTYTNAIATSNFTPPTHASLFTGLYPSWHGAHFDPPAFVAGRPLPTRFPTLASILSGHGYRTMAVVANWGGLSPVFGLQRGFQLYDARYPRAVVDHRLLRHLVPMLFGRLVPGTDFDARFRRAKEINRTASTLLDRVAREQTPFFLFVNYMDAHVPYVPPPPFCRLYSDGALSFSEIRYAVLERRIMTRQQVIVPKERNELIAPYDGGIRYIDSQIALLLGRLKELGLFDNTMIVIASDHGEAFGEHGLMQHGVSVYQDQAHVPLIIKYPHQRHSRGVNELVSQGDVMPTVLSALGFKPPKFTQGEDLQAHQGITPRFVVSESFSWMGKFNHRLERVERAFFSGKMKFITSTNGKRQLYDLSLDPGELHNLVATDALEAQTLEKRLAAWTNDIPSNPNATPKDNKEVVHVLRSLGYLQ